MKSRLLNRMILIITLKQVMALLAELNQTSLNTTVFVVDNQVTQQTLKDQVLTLLML